MAYVRCSSNVIIDNAHCDGLTTVLGIGRDWEAVEDKDDSFGFTPDVAGQYSWWYRNLFEYVAALKGIAPIRTCTEADMSLSAWEAPQGKWRISSKAAMLGHGLLEFYDGRPGLYASNEYGKLVSTSGALGPNLQFLLWRTGRATDETDPAMFEIHFRPTTGTEYALCFPAQGAAGKTFEDATGQTDAQFTHPFLMGKPSNEATWSIVSQSSQGAAPRLAGAVKTPKMEAIRIEYDDGMLLVRMGDGDRAWVVGGDWQTTAGATQHFALTAGYIDVYVIGHTAAFGMYPLTAPTGKVLLPHKYLIVTSDYNPTPTYLNIAHVPAGTSLTTAADAKDALTQRPAVTFGTSGALRPILYNVQEYRAATIGGAVSEPLDSFDAPSFMLMEVSGEDGERWRGSSITATVQNRVGHDLATVKPNAKVIVNVQATGAPVTMFTGYAAAPEAELLPGNRLGATTHGKISAKLVANDIIEARLSKKQMLHHCSYEAWTEGNAFSHILNRAGVPAALISVDAACNRVLPSASQRGSRKFKFSPDCGVISALDTIAAAFGRQWGVTNLGVVRLAPAYVHTPGYYDFTLTEDTLVAEDLVDSFRSTRTFQDFRNFLLVMVGEGNDATAKLLMDTSSMRETTALNFIGDIWQQFVAYPDGSDIDTIAQALWDEIARWHHYVEWGMKDRPELMRDSEVRIQVAPAVVPSNSIFRILSKSWACQRDGRYSQTLQSVRVE